MERNEITAEISILELDHEEIFIRKEEGSPNSLSNMLNAAVTQLFIDMAMEAPGDNNDPKTFIQKITTLYSIALLTSLQNMAEQYSKAAQISDKKQFFIARTVRHEVQLLRSRFCVEQIRLASPFQT